LFSTTTRLAKRLRHLLGVEPHGDVEAGAGGQQRHDGDGFRWIIVAARRRRERERDQCKRDQARVNILDMKTPGDRRPPGA
jgi:hypothetical protein